MNYKLAYESLVSGAKNKCRSKKSGEYFELHHILPRSLGGDNKKENLVLLTAKEHFLAHHLLVKIYKSDSMHRAFWMMCHASGKNKSYIIDRRITSVVYAKARIASSILMAEMARRVNTGRKLTPEHIAKITANRSNKFTTQGFKHSIESKAAIAASSTGRLHTDEAKQKIGTAKRGTKLTTETIEKIKLSRVGLRFSDEAKKNMSNAHKGRIKSEAHRENLRQAGLKNSHRRGMKWFTNGVISYMARECPEGFALGRKLKSIDDGSTNI